MFGWIWSSIEIFSKKKETTTAEIRKQADIIYIRQAFDILIFHLIAIVTKFRFFSRNHLCKIKIN